MWIATGGAGGKMTEKVPTPTGFNVGFSANIWNAPRFEGMFQKMRDNKTWSLGVPFDNELGDAIFRLRLFRHPRRAYTFSICRSLSEGWSKDSAATCLPGTHDQVTEAELLNTSLHHWSLLVLVCNEDPAERRLQRHLISTAHATTQHITITCSVCCQTHISTPKAHFLFFQGIHNV